MLGFWSALQFLTRIPVPRADYYRLESAVVLLPAVRVPLGVRCCLAVALLALPGAVDADGLMDTCDAVFGHATPERRLEIMRDPHVGAFGVGGLVCVAGLKIAAIGGL